MADPAQAAGRRARHRRRALRQGAQHCATRAAHRVGASISRRYWHHDLLTQRIRHRTLHLTAIPTLTCTSCGEWRRHVAGWRSVLMGRLGSMAPVQICSSWPVEFWGAVAARCQPFSLDDNEIFQSQSVNFFAELNSSFCRRWPARCWGAAAAAPSTHNHNASFHFLDDVETCVELPLLLQVAGWVLGRCRGALSAQSHCQVSFSRW